jgi:lipopolysaccharide biosynthesis protein
MFWFRPRAFEPLALLELEAVQKNELAHIDGTLAHTIEQLLAAVVTKNGYIVEQA